MKALVFPTEIMIYGTDNECPVRVTVKSQRRADTHLQRTPGSIAWQAWTRVGGQDRPATILVRI